MRSGNIQVIEWWQARHMVDYFFVWPRDAISEAVRCGHVHVLDWWRKCGFPGFVPDRFIEDCVGEASEAGQVQVLDWLLKYMDASVVGGQDADEQEAALKWPVFQSDWIYDGKWQYDVMGHTARFGHVDVLEWWMSKSEQGLVIRPTLETVIRVAVMENQVGVLEWCKNYPDTVKQRHQDCFVSSPAVVEKWIRAMIKHVLVEWVDALGLDWSDKERELLCLYSALNIPSLKWLLDKGWLGNGSVSGCLNMALCSPDVDLHSVEWIHSRIQPRVACPEYIHFYFPAVLSGHVHVLDWLVARGYSFPKSQYVEYCVEASNFGNAHVLDWLVEKARADGVQLEEDLVRAVFEDDVLQRATDQGFLQVLEWWAKQVGSRLLQTPADYLASKAIKIQQVPNLLDPACGNGHADVIEWWLLEDSDLAKALKKWFACDPGVANDSIIKLCGDQDMQNQQQLRILNALQQSGRFPTDDSSDRKSVNYTGSLLWWWANVPQVQGLVPNRGHYRDPIDIYTLKYMLKVPMTLLPVTTIDALSGFGRTDVLEYLKREGHWTTQCMEEASVKALKAATKKHCPHVLEWWKQVSGVEVRYPKGMGLWSYYGENGDTIKWWIASGLWHEDLDKSDEEEPDIDDWGFLPVPDDGWGEGNDWGGDVEWE
ncbi:hypothetical protein BCR44DRAFT_24575 [Catenaria anguillulae PL171]|uniref:Ankyrin repeat-containing domain protein n=1 Tax=Catenaria anguillulae PL171 TaxID=765915 RepID=A0A1Y2H7Y7_9FUNG|nr:hypothetical protein BCR44DRAFT_24575 [Catenaria anguillulae PL171]